MGGIDAVGGDVSPTAGGRKRDKLRDAVSQKGAVVAGRPPPGVAGRETHVLKEKLRRTEAALVASTAREVAAKRMIEHLKEGSAMPAPAPGSVEYLAYGSPPRPKSPSEAAHNGPVPRPTKHPHQSHVSLPGI